ncbi:serine/threonine protein kinase [Arthrobacter sp. I2-34]|uniref:non-specific serine/threonine protein kinase n=1 Tax=Arthrobacter hankyongi TaxID=2904801 RepID=A0ABS9L866_9MICC|nr:serine/threonine-protein kinase [Arthrobacter hankyongi]MCG2622821.1 serine/threonine protein kinase [Arthrobacter hankyongi]
MDENLAPEPSNSLLGGRYRLGPVIGRGGMGAVHRGLDQVLDREVAVKVFGPDQMDPGQLRWQQQEIAMLARLNHPGLVALYDAGSSPCDGGTLCWLVMELIPGADLGLYLEFGPLDLGATARIGAELADALHYIHRCNVVHRDVKPGNIVMARYFDDDGPRPKLADFGIAKTMDAVQLAYADTSLGTAGYLSPEQVTGADVGPASDVYSLGLVLLQCLTGRVEYPGPAMESALARLARPPGIPASLDPHMAGLLEAMTATEPRRRPDCLEAARTLRRIAGRDEAPAGRDWPAAGWEGAAAGWEEPAAGWEGAAVGWGEPAAGWDRPPAGRDADTAVYRPAPTARLFAEEAPDSAGPAPAPILPALEANQLTNATQAWPWLPLSDLPAWQPLPDDGFTRSGSRPTRGLPGRLLRLALGAAVVLIFASAALVFGAALLGPALSGLGPSPSPAVPAQLEDHLRQLEGSLTP